MTPIYFPFTYVSGVTLGVLRACFAQTTVFQPLTARVPEDMQSWARQGVLKFHFPTIIAQDRLERIVDDYFAWAESAAGSRGAPPRLIERFRKSPPHDSGTLSSWIVADIKSKLTSASQQPAEDLNLEAAAFLYFAQEFDRHHQSVTSDFAAVEKQHRMMIESLQGRPETEGVERRPSGNPADTPGGNFMIADRILAWSRLFAAEPVESGLLVTGDPEVYELISDNTPGVRELIRRMPVPADSEAPEAARRWRADLMTCLERLASNPRHSPDAGSLPTPPCAATANRFYMSLYYAPDQPPTRVLAGVSGDFRTMPTPAGRGESPSTLLALIHP